MKSHEQKAVGHTAGEWKLAVGVIDPDKVWSEGKDGNEVLIARGIDNPADSILISQAPAMLEALESLAPMWDNDSPLLNVYKAEIEQARAIIARAKGEA